MLIESLKNWLENYTEFSAVILLAALIVFSIVAYLVVKHFVLKLAAKVIRKTKIKFDDHILESGVFERLSLIVPLIVLYYTSSLFPEWANKINGIFAILFVVIISSSVTLLLKGLLSYYSTLDIAKRRPIKGYVQIVNLIIYLLAAIFIIGIVTGRSPWELFAGLGALTAILMLIFRTTILSFVASIQIANNDLLHVGDWIEMPKFGANGDVIDIALYSLKVQNWDKTITVIPTYKLIEESFKNWRGMVASGGRRIKRAIYIDLNSIFFCQKEDLDHYESIDLIHDYVKSKRQNVIETNNTDERPFNSRRLTNVGTFRKYVEAYIKSHPNVHKDMTCMVRQLAPSSNGLPLEIYLFTNDIEWVNYEQIQADIFDHLLAILPEFGLRVYQQPSGKDLSQVGFTGS